MGRFDSGCNVVEPTLKRDSLCNVVVTNVFNTLAWHCCILLGDEDKKQERLILSDNGPRYFSHLRAAIETGLELGFSPLPRGNTDP